MNRLDQDLVVTLRAVLSEAALELRATPATQAKMAEVLVLTAAEGCASREQLKSIALEIGRTPAA